MSRLLPQPILSLMLLLTWLLLVNSVAPGQVLLGALVGLLIPLFSARFWTEPTQLRRPLAFLVYALRVLYDIIIANLTVARLILTMPRHVRSRFLRYPLTLRDEFAIAFLANTITLT
ncbi:MAG: Na+/H+ antiporter subunit E, partial [Candidatus Competibacterales bacterium]|nr:Na+/H+ antiporter subunit E [Candidatus Competibacterales bacterium]